MANLETSSLPAGLAIDLKEVSPRVLMIPEKLLLEASVARPPPLN